MRPGAAQLGRMPARHGTIHFVRAISTQPPVIVWHRAVSARPVVPLYRCPRTAKRHAQRCGRFCYLLSSETHHGGAVRTSSSIPVIVRASVMAGSPRGLSHVVFHLISQTQACPHLSSLEHV